MIFNGSTKNYFLDGFGKLTLLKTVHKKHEYEAGHIEGVFSNGKLVATKNQKATISIHMVDQSHEPGKLFEMKNFSFVLDEYRGTFFQFSYNFFRV